MWRLKVLTQFILAKLPFGETLNHSLQRVKAGFRGGNERKVRDRIKYVGEGLQRLTALMPLEGATVVEIGTGWDALPTLMLYAAGADRIYTYDHVPHLRAGLVASVVRILASQTEIVANFVGSAPAAIETRLSRLITNETTSLSHLLQQANIIYQAPGDATATGLPDNSADLYYSYAVLSHVPDQVIGAVANEARRVLKPDGLYFAAIGLQDQYSYDPAVSEVNFLRYPEWLWALFVKNKISYTNRLREPDFLEILERQGARLLKVVSVLKPENLQRVMSMKIDKRFARYTAGELATTHTEIVAGWPGRAVPHAPVREQREVLLCSE
jgi:SAM-dependent methyltransferase